MNFEFSRSSFTRPIGIIGLAVLVLAFSSIADAQDGKLVQALGIMPKQSISFEQPEADVIKECTFATTKSPSGFVVHHSSGRILRRFIDNNGDNKLDQWSYYKNGLEVYRDIDANFDGRTDAYRWVGPGGTRWGLDQDQNGMIDQWKVISAEEVAFECFEAIRLADTKRFERLLLTEQELDAFQLGPRIRSDVEARLKQAKSGFATMIRTQKAITKRSSFIDAGNGRPQTLVAGTFESQRDLTIYDQASAFFESESANQLTLGSLVRAGEVWRMIELPEVVDSSQPLSNGGAFFPLPEFGGSTAGPTGSQQELAKLYDGLTKIEEALADAKGSKMESLEQQKAQILAQFYEKTIDPKSKQDWLENLADSVAHSYQMDRFEGGMDFLGKFLSDHKGESGLDYVAWTGVFAKYGWVNSNGDKKERDSAYGNLIVDLEDFQNRYPKSEFSGDALIQLAVHHEVNSEDEPEKAVDLYRNCVKRFGDSKYGRRAEGALKRLDGFGKNVALVGKTASGRNFDIKNAKGKIVLLHFWEIYCCSDNDIKELAKLAEKYKDDMVIVGCNIEGISPNEEAAAATKRFTDFVKAHPDMAWLQIHAPGSVEQSPLAHQLGIATGPSFFLVDKTGKLVESNLGIAGLEREIERERRR
ncbi:MAG: hypothetical protein ACI87E_003115 [Mariniblastus sp.]|jgi:hypothetical protein